jgi:hypothetical protein
MFGNKTSLQFGQTRQHDYAQDSTNFNNLSTLSAGDGPKELESVHSFVFSQLKPDEK